MKTLVTFDVCVMPANYVMELCHACGSRHLLVLCSEVGLDTSFRWYDIDAGMTLTLV